MFDREAQVFDSDTQTRRTESAQTRRDDPEFVVGKRTANWMEVIRNLIEPEGTLSLNALS